MNYIVLDLEWNQPTGESDAVKEPIYLSGEIIEIGAVKLNDQFQTVDEIRIYVTPKFYPQLNQRVAALTKINSSCLKKNGIPFPEAYEQFCKWCGEEYSWMSWSDSDLITMIENLQIHGMDTMHLPVCYDVQRIFDREIMRDDRQCSLDKAIEVLGESGDRAHDALHDARNTVRVCDHLDLETYIDEYGSQVFAEPVKSPVYDTTADILHDRKNAEFTCPWCGETVTVEGWLPMNGHRFMGMGSCGEEDEFILYLNIYRSPEGYQVSRVLYEMSDDLWDRYQDKLDVTELIPVEIEEEPVSV